MRDNRPSRELDVDQPFRAEQLDEPDAAAQTRPAGAPVGGVAEVLRTDADDDVGAGVARERGGAVRRDQKPLPAELAVNGVAVAFDAAAQQIHHRRPKERGDEQVPRLVVELLWRPLLLEETCAQHGDARAHGHRFELVVCHVHRRHAELALKPDDLGPQLGPLREAILQGAAKRVRPMFMTALTAIFGLLPAALSTRIGAQTQRPLAIVVVGGVIMTLLLNRYLMPVLYSFYGHRDPPESARGLRLSIASSPSSLAVRSTRLRISAFGMRRARSGNARLSYTLMCG